MSREMVLENVRRFRAIASIYRQTAAFRPEQSWSLLGQAKDWEYIAHWWSWRATLVAPAGKMLIRVSKFWREYSGQLAVRSRIVGRPALDLPHFHWKE